MPGGELERGLLKAAVEILRPIVAQLIASGVVFGHLESRLRELFVRVAEQEFEIPGRAQTDSRLSVLTGINRKEVRRIRSTASVTRPTSFQRNLGADLVSRWMADRSATDRSGQPLPIPFRAKTGPSFVRLVRETTSDLRPRAILDELLRTGTVEMTDSRTIRLRAPAYIPTHGKTEKLAMLGEDPTELVQTMLHNIFTTRGRLWLQQKVSYDNIGADATDRVRAVLRRKAEHFLTDTDRLLAHYDRDRNPQAPGGARRYAGLGVYYFESGKSPTRRDRGSQGDDDDARESASPPGAAAVRRRVRRRTKRHGDQR
jgi:Family of unknown function (DUF6502)